MRIIVFSILALGGLLFFTGAAPALLNRSTNPRSNSPQVRGADTEGYLFPAGTLIAGVRLPSDKYYRWFRGQFPGLIELDNGALLFVRIDELLDSLTFDERVGYFYTMESRLGELGVPTNRLVNNARRQYPNKYADELRQVFLMQTNKLKASSINLASLFSGVEISA